MSSVLEHNMTAGSDEELDDGRPATIADLLESLGGIDRRQVFEDAGK